MIHFFRLVFLVHHQPRNCTKEHKRKTGYGDGGGHETSCPYLLQRKANGGQRPLPPLILEGELVTTAFDGQRSSNHKSELLGYGDFDSRGFQDFDYFCSETPYMDVFTTLHTKGKYALHLVYDR